MVELNIESGDTTVAPKGLKSAIEFNANYTLKDPNHDEIKDGYGLNWVGKNYAKLVSGLATETVVIPDVSHNAEPLNADSQNVFLTGDNLDVLKHLQNAYTGKVDMIYIDPPYNTGSDGFVYPDNFKFTDVQLKNTLGLTDAEVQKVKNIEGKASHSAWLTFMYPRLFIAKRLLKETGVIFISIDDNEQPNLKLLCDEVFGEGNFVNAATIIGLANESNDGVLVQSNSEGLLIYARNQSKAIINRIDPVDESYRALNDAPTGLATRESMGYTIYYNPTNNDMIPEFDYDFSKVGTNNENEIYLDNQELINSGYFPVRPGRRKGVVWRWRWGVDKFNDEKERIQIRLNRNGNYVAEFLQEGFNPPRNVQSFGTGTTELYNLFGSDVFDSPKSTDLLYWIERLGSNTHSLILDFFAGSGTTAHAVERLNADENGNRNWILCTLKQPIDNTTEIGKNALKMGFNTIDEISRERIRRAGQQILEKYEAKEAEGSNEGTLLDPAINAPLAGTEIAGQDRNEPEQKWNKDIGFKHFRVVTPDVNTIDRITEFDPETNAILAEDMLSEFGYDNTSGCDTILTTYLLDDGYELTHSPDEIDIAGYKAYYIADSVLYLINQGWGADQTKELLNLVGTNKLNLNTIVIYGYSFTFESLRELELNVKQSLDKSVNVEKRY